MIAPEKVGGKTLPAAIDIISNLNDQQINDFFEMLIEKEGDYAKDIERGTNGKST